MKRSVFYTIITAALVPAASLLAAPSIETAPNQLRNRIADTTYQIQMEADGLQGYVRSGAHDRRSTYAYAYNLDQSLRKLNSLVDEVASQPGATNQARQRAGELKVEVVELKAVISDTVNELDPNTLALHANAVFADTSNIGDRGAMIRNTAEDLAGAN